MPNYKEFDLDVQNNKTGFDNNISINFTGYSCIRECPIKDVIAANTQGPHSCRNTVCDM